MDVMKRSRPLLILLLAMMPVAAHAEALSPQLADMIRSVVESGDAPAANAVVRLAKKSNLQASAEIDALFEAVERTCPILNLLRNPQSIRAEVRHTDSSAPERLAA